MGSIDLLLEHFKDNLKEKYEKSLIRQNKADGTINNYTIYIDRLSRSETQEELDKEINNLDARTGVYALRSYIRFLLDRNIVEQNVLREIQPPPKRGSIDRSYIPKKRWRLYIKKGINRCHKMYLYLGFYLGLRCGELAHLRVSDVDLRSNEINIRIQKEIKDKEGNIIQEEWSPKGNKERTVMINDRMCAYLERWIQEERFVYGRKLKHNYILFHPKTGKHLSERTWQRWTKKVGQQHPDDPEDFTSHIMRYSFAEELYRQSGNDIKYVSHVLGHSNISITSNYLRVQQKEMESKGARYMP